MNDLAKLSISIDKILRLAEESDEPMLAHLLAMASLEISKRLEAEMKSETVVLAFVG